MSLRPPRQFGRYRIQQVLGHGGMGSVFLAHDGRLDRPVALKTPREDGPLTGDALRRFEREAKAAATLRHPNLCRIYDVGEFEGIHFLTMEFIEGDRLADFVAQCGPLDPRTAAELVRLVALGMAEAHAKGVTHRDLKPSNIMIDENGRPVVVDFGLARRDVADDRRLTPTDTFLGTRAYASPEQWRCDPRDVGPASDIYSLGVVLFELLTGHVPFPGPTPENQMHQVLTQEAPAPSTLRPSVDPKLDVVCGKAMAKGPEGRFPTMTAFAEALEGWLRTAGTVPPLPSLSKRGTAATTVQRPEEAPRPSPPTLIEEVASVRPPPIKKAEANSATFGGVVQRVETVVGLRGRRAWAIAAALALLVLAALLAGRLKKEVPREDDSTAFSTGPPGPPTAPSEPGGMTVTRARGDVLNVVREAAHAGAAVVGSVRAGQGVRVLRESGDGGKWLLIANEEGREIGWISREYLVPLEGASRE